MPSLRVRVTPRAKRPRWELAADGTVRLWVTAPPAEGAANEAARELLASVLKVPKSAITLAAGQASRDKRFDITAWTRPRSAAGSPPDHEPRSARRAVGRRGSGARTGSIPMPNAGGQGL